MGIWIPRVSPLGEDVGKWGWGGGGAVCYTRFTGLQDEQDLRRGAGTLRMIAGISIHYYALHGKRGGTSDTQISVYSFRCSVFRHFHCLGEGDKMKVLMKKL